MADPCAVVHVGVSVGCVTCGRTKAPRGRSVARASYGSYCDHDCEGYALDPCPGSLWLGETCREFGYRHCQSCGTREQRPDEVADEPDDEGTEEGKSTPEPMTADTIPHDRLMKTVAQRVVAVNPCPIGAPWQ